MLFFEVLPVLAWSSPASLNEIYAYIIAREKELNLRLTLRELRAILREFECRNIVKIVDKSELKVMLTEDAKYFLIVYKPHGV